MATGVHRRRIQQCLKQCNCSSKQQGIAAPVFIVYTAVKMFILDRLAAQRSCLDRELKGRPWLESNFPRVVQGYDWEIFIFRCLCNYKRYPLVHTVFEKLYLIPASLFVTFYAHSNHVPRTVRISVRSFYAFCNFNNNFDFNKNNDFMKNNKKSYLLGPNP